MKQRAIELQLVKPITPGSSGTKGKIFLKDLLKEELNTLNVPYQQNCCQNSVLSALPVRYNTSTNELEFFNGTNWTSLGINAEPMDIFLIGGQSNARGRGESNLTSPNPQSGTVYQYVSGTGLEEMVDEIKDATCIPAPCQDAMNSSPWPSFGITYHNATKRKICFVQTAKSSAGMMSESMTAVGGDPTVNWGPTGVLYEPAVATLQSAMVAVAEAGYFPVFRGILWIQGETEALAINAGAVTAAQYKTATLDMIARFRADLGTDTPFYIYKIGSRTATDDTGFAAVRNAQEEIIDSDQVRNIMVFRGAYDFIARSMMADAIHWSTAGANEAGRISANNIASSQVEKNNTIMTRKIIGGTSTTSGLTLQTTSGGDGTQFFNVIGGNNGSKTLINIPISISGVQVWNFNFNGNRGLIRVNSGTDAGYTGFQFTRGTTASRAQIMLLDDTGSATGTADSQGKDYIISTQIGNIRIGATNTGGLPNTAIHINETRSVAIASSSQAHSSAIFDVYSPNNDKGSNPFPVMTEAQRLAIGSPKIGLHVYQSDGTEGIYVNKSAGWTFAY